MGSPANLATNYFSHNHLKLAENLINSGNGSFLNNHLLSAKINENGVSPEKTEDDSPPPLTQTPISHLGGMDRKAEFDFSKVNGEYTHALNSIYITEALILQLAFHNIPIYGSWNAANVKSNARHVFHGANTICFRPPTPVITLITIGNDHK